MLIRILFFTACLGVLPSMAFATCPAANTVQILASGATQSFASSDDGSGNCEPKVAVANTPTVNIGQVGGTNVVGDPCAIQTPTYTPISITSATTTLIATGTAAKKTYICSVNLFTGLANNVALIEGTTATTCGTSPVGVIGGATAANGFNFAANGGETFGSGVASIAATATAHDDVCIITSSAGPLAGVMKWVQQ